MKKRMLSCLLILTTIFMGQCVTAEDISKRGVNNSENIENTEGNVNVDTSFIVKYKKGKARNLFSVGGESENNLDIEVINYGEEKSVDEVKRELGDSVEYVQPNYILELAAVKSDESNIADENNVKNTAVGIQSGSTEVIVGIIDSEIDKSNNELSGLISNKEYSCVDNSNLFEGELGFEQMHGTHIAGIVGGKSNVLHERNKNNIRIMPLTVFKGSQARTSDIINAINYAKDNNADIINMSFGCSEENIALKEAIESAPEILFITAAGNFRRSIDEKPVYPAAYNLPNLISVTSINDDGGLCYFSDYGESNVDIAAIGKDIDSTMPDNKRSYLSGTSMSAAVVSRGAALLYSNNMCSSPEDYKELLISSADKISSLTGYVGNSAKLNVENALNSVSKTSIEKINYNDEFSISPEVYDEETSYKLFAASKTIDIKSGMAHTIALKEDGTVWAWGDNTYGQLGNGTYTSSTYPVRVKGLNGITKIEAGGYHNFAYKTGGYIYVWGRGDRGQLGRGTSNYNTPSTIGGDRSNFSAGLMHSIIADQNSVYVFGDNSAKQLGNTVSGSYTSSPTKVVLPSSFNYSDIQSVGAGYNKTFFTTDAEEGVYPLNGVLFGFGEGISDNLKIIERDKSDYKRKFAIGRNHAISYLLGTGNDNSNSAFVMGTNEYGEQGNGNISSNNTMGWTSSLSMYTDLAAGDGFTIGLKPDGTVYSWGKTFYSAAQMAGTLTYSVNHTKIPVSNIKAIAAGDNFAIFLDSSGNMWGLGKNDKGQLGNGTTNNATTPVKVTEREINEDTTAIKVAVGTNHYIALKEDGTVWTWGKNEYGQLGNGTTAEETYPIKVSGLSGITDVKAGNGFCLALKSDGTLWAWGKNDYGQLGNGTKVNSSVPVKVNTNKQVKAISAGYEHCLMVTTEKLAYAWGRGDSYRLCNLSTTDKNVPELIPNLTYLADVAAGYNHSVLLKQDGTVYTCGDNSYNKLGGNRNGNRQKPVAVMNNAKGISAGKERTLILDKNGIIYACGDNTYGKLGIDKSITVEDFTAVPGLNNVTEIVSGGFYNTARTSDGKYYIWGANGQPFYACSGYSENDNVFIMDLSNISFAAIGEYDILFIKDNTIFTKRDGFFVPMSWNYKDTLPPEKGKGIKSDPYLIYNLVDFYKIRNNVSACYKLMADFDMCGDQMWPMSTFYGNFDGNNHYISNFKIKINDDGYEFLALFAEVYDATIENLNISGAEISGDSFAGVIAGEFDNSILRNCNVSDASVSCLNGEPGGLVGRNMSSQIINCTFSSKDMANVTFTKNISVTKGQKYKFLLTCNNADDVSAIRYSVVYDTNMMAPQKIGENPVNKDSTGIYIDSNIKNVSNEAGVLSFEINSSNKNWSGVVCPIEFSAFNTGNTQLKVRVGNPA